MDILIFIGVMIVISILVVVYSAIIVGSKSSSTEDPVLESDRSRGTGHEDI